MFKGKCVGGPLHRRTVEHDLDYFYADVTPPVEPRFHPTPAVIDDFETVKYVFIKDPPMWVLDGMTGIDIAYALWWAF